MAYRLGGGRSIQLSYEGNEQRILGVLVLELRQVNLLKLLTRNSGKPHQLQFFPYAFTDADTRHDD